MANPYPILKDNDGRSIPCAQCHHRMARHIHHILPRCEGGSDDPQNLIHVCQQCHVAIHSTAGDFSRWGRMGGKVTAQRGLSLRNLKQFQGDAGMLRLEIYLEKSVMVIEGWQ